MSLSRVRQGEHPQNNSETIKNREQKIMKLNRLLCKLSWSSSRWLFIILPRDNNHRVWVRAAMIEACWEGKYLIPHYSEGYEPRINSQTHPKQIDSVLARLPSVFSFVVSTLVEVKKRCRWHFAHFSSNKIVLILIPIPEKITGWVINYERRGGESRTMAKEVRR